MATLPIARTADVPRDKLPRIALVVAIHALLLFAVVTGDRVVRSPERETVIWLSTIVPAAVKPPPPPPPPPRPKHKPGPRAREAAAPPLRDIEVQPRTEIVATITDAPAPVAPAGGKPDGTGTAGAGDVGLGAGGAGGAVHVPVRVRAVLDPDNCSRPRLPARAEEMRLAGHVVLAVQIGVDGRVTNARVARSSSHADLDDTALAGVRTCQFVAATVDKVPAPSWELFRFSWYNRCRVVNRARYLLDRKRSKYSVPRNFLTG